MWEGGLDGVKIVVEDAGFAAVAKQDAVLADAVRALQPVPVPGHLRRWPEESSHTSPH